MGTSPRYVPLPVTPAWASERSQRLRKQLELSQLHQRLVWTDPVSGATGEGLTALLWRIKQIQTGDTRKLEDVPEREYTLLEAESESWLK